MKILHLIYDHINNPWVGGGGAVRVYEIYKRLSQKGYKITVVSGKYPKAIDYNVNENFKYKFIGISKNYILSTFSYAFYGTRFLKQHCKDFNIIVEDFAPWNPLFSYKLKDKKPVILQTHHKEGKNILRRYKLFGLPFYYIESLYPKKFDNIITVSEISKKKFGIKDTVVISNGIDEIFLEYQDANKSNKFYCLFLGRIDFYHKGIDILLEAFKDLDIPLYIAGSGKDIDKLKITKENIRYIGYVSNEDKISILKNAKFLIVPSRYEGQGVVVLESAAVGTPVIVSDIAELNFTVEGGFGISFKKENAKDLREKVLYLWNNNDLLGKMSLNAINFAKNYTWDTIADQYEKYLLKVFNDKKF